ncbi:MAG TPA: hypothetical protein VHB77_18640 [Planctomycetaceae bacterium]|nr:hypothetical protein [Planctomycetaceae bacterium]
MGHATFRSSRLSVFRQMRNERSECFNVSGRGLLHLSVLISASEFDLVRMR